VTRSVSPTVCAVVLNWNRAADTLDCLRSLLPAVAARKLGVLVCDNASSDQSRTTVQHWAEAHFDFIEADASDLTWDFALLNTGGNRGYSGGNNVGIRHALKRGFDFIWILNNDTAVADTALDRLLECALRNPDKRIIGSTLLDYHDRERIQYAGGGVYHPETTICRFPLRGEKYADLDRTTPCEPLDYVTGASLFCRASVFREIGLFDEDYFLYFEELDLVARLPEGKAGLYWCADSVVYHKEGASMAGLGPSASPRGYLDAPDRDYYENRSALLFTKKHHRRWLISAALARFLGKAGKFVLHNRLHLFPALIRAYRDALFRPRQPMRHLVLESPETVVWRGVARETPAPPGLQGQ